MAEGGPVDTRPGVGLGGVDVLQLGRRPLVDLYRVDRVDRVVWRGHGTSIPARSGVGHSVVVEDRSTMAGLGDFTQRGVESCRGGEPNTVVESLYQGEAVGRRMMWRRKR